MFMTKLRMVAEGKLGSVSGLIESSAGLTLGIKRQEVQGREATALSCSENPQKKTRKWKLV